MKKVGFIDYYLDQWHANNYPELISKCSDGRYCIGSAYAKIDSPHGGMTNRQWSKKYGIPLKGSIREVIDDSDVLIVMSPNNPEQHPELCALALRSGKRVYVDKTFAICGDAAREIFEIAEKHNTPCYSSSALRFSSELQDIDRSKIDRLYSEGPGFYDTYSIHQIEMIVALMQAKPTRVMFTGTEMHPSMLIEFSDGRTAQMYQRSDAAYSFRLTAVDTDGKAEIVDIKSDFFNLFIKGLIKFFDTGEMPVPHNDTVSVISIREAGLRAMKKPFSWESVK